jgi:hypothetical protein
MELIDKTLGSSPRKNWKLDETNYLIYIADKHCLLHQINVNDLDSADWENIAEFLPGRTGNSCQFRFLSLAPKSISDTPWLPEER